MNKHRLLITDAVDEGGLQPIARYFSIDKKIGITKDELTTIIDTYECVITRSSTAFSSNIIQKGLKLKIIGRAGIGVDNIDIFAATSQGIAVINAPQGNARATAEHTIGMIFALLRHIPQAHADLIRGIWGKQKYVGTQLYGKTLGIVGFGNVGRQVYRLAKGIGLDVVVCEPYVRMPKNITHLTYEELLVQCDIVSFHVPMTYLTRSMLNKSTIRLCKSGAYIINCSRGAVVDNEAVKKALIGGQIAGFAVDVFNKEPEVDAALLSLPNVIATPHIAGSTVESQKQSVHEVVSGILQYISGTAPKNLLNPQVFKKKLRAKSKKRLDFDAVVFDCDSTVCNIEGIDELASFFGKKKKISFLTKEAMEGKRNFESVYRERLELLHPSRIDFARLGQLYKEHIVDDAKDVIEALIYLGKAVYLVSSSYIPALLQLAQTLGLPTKNIFANDILFDANGKYRSYIEGPLIRNHGKLQIIRQIPGRKVMIGDGVTDLETKELIDLFIGYGGVAKRPKVETESDIYLYSKSMAPVLVLTAGYEGCIKLLSTKYRRFVGKGLDLLSHANHVKVGKQQVSYMADFKRLAYY